MPPRHFIERSLHAAEPGIAAVRRQLERVQHRCVRGLRRIAHVGVPGRVAVPERPDRLALFVEHVRHDVDVGITGRGLAARALVRRRIERAEMPREREEVVVGHFLVAEYEDIVPVPGSLDGLDLGLAHGREIHTPHLGADGSGRDDLDFERDGHAVSPGPAHGYCSAAHRSVQCAARPPGYIIRIRRDSTREETHADATRTPDRSDSRRSHHAR